MSLPRLCSRVARLEQHAARVRWYADIVVTFGRLMAEAGAAVGLAPAGVQELCTALAQTLHAFSQDVPVCITDPQAVEAFMARVAEAMLTLLDTQVPDPHTRSRLRAQLAEAFAEEDKRRTADPLEAQRKEWYGRRDRR
jgi:hypothetical protein